MGIHNVERGSSSRRPQSAEDKPALIVATRAGAILFASTSARRWLRELLGRAPSPDRLPREIRRWLSGAGPYGTEQSLVLKRDETCLFVTRFMPHLKRSVALVLEKRSSNPGEGGHGALTEQENRVLRWVARGKSNREIAGALGIAPATVGKHLEHIFRKLHVRNRTAAATHWRPKDAAAKHSSGNN